jgi:hypothetical protein
MTNHFKFLMYAYDNENQQNGRTQQQEQDIQRSNNARSPQNSQQKQTSEKNGSLQQEQQRDRTLESSQNRNQEQQTRYSHDYGQGISQPSNTYKENQSNEEIPEDADKY